MNCKNTLRQKEKVVGNKAKMSTKYKHFIITRYNLNIQSWTTTKNLEKIDDNWMEHRFKVFSKYCFPSVINQTNQNFTWLIFLNIDTKEKYKNEIFSLIKKFSNIKIIQVDGYKKFLFSLKQTILGEIQHQSYIITTRLDNDDCIRNDFIQLVQDQFDNQYKLIIDFPKGLTFEIEPGYRLVYRRMHLNPFISLIENVDSFQTVMHYFQHRGWQRSTAKIKSLNNCRPWLQLVHEKNRLNTLKGLILSGRYKLLSIFGISLSKDLAKPNFIPIIKHFLHVFKIRMNNRLKYIISKV